MTSTFLVHIKNFKGLGLPAKDRSGSSDPYLMGNFDNFKKFKSKTKSKTLNPDWGSFSVMFNYETRYIGRLSKKKLKIECFDKDRISHDDFIGDVCIDLHTLATGPSQHNVLLRDKGKPAGRLQFMLEMHHMTTMKICLKNIAINYPPGVSAPRDVRLHYHIEGEEKGDKYKTEPGVIPTWDELPAMEFTGSIANVSESVVAVSLRSKGGHVLASGKIPLKDYFSISDWQLIPFEIPLQAESNEYRGTVNMSGQLYYTNPPQMTNMVGGVHSENGIQGGKMMYSFLQYPNKMKQPPPALHQPPNAGNANAPAASPFPQAGAQSGGQAQGGMNGQANAPPASTDEYPELAGVAFQMAGSVSSKYPTFDASSAGNAPPQPISQRMESSPQQPQVQQSFIAQNQNQNYNMGRSNTAQPQQPQRSAPQARWNQSTNFARGVNAVAGAGYQKEQASEYVQWGGVLRGVEQPPNRDGIYAGYRDQYNQLRKEEAANPLVGPPVAAPATNPAARTKGLPPGWEMRYTPNNRPFYVNHNTRQTTWERPSMQPQGAPSQFPPATQSLPTQYSGYNVQQMSPSAVSSASLPVSLQGAMYQSSPQVNSPRAPATYEVRIDMGTSQPYYVDHKKRETTWNVPRGAQRQATENLPVNWEARKDKKGRIYYVNHQTKQTQWSKPLEGALPQGWEKRADKKGRTYYVNHITKTTSWKDPRT